MCGIIASVSKTNVLSDIFKSLNRLEYRGYDSSGIAFLNTNSDIQCFKYKGMVNILQSKFNFNTSTLTCIGHTRWATHGEPSDINSHPHCNESIALVHNGIIENYVELKKQLLSKGYEFKSTTDTEVVLNLLSEINKKQKNKIEALIELFELLQGSFALVIIFKGDKNIYGIKRNNPLIVGFNKSENKHFISSDIYAIVDLAKQSVQLNDNEIVMISKDNATFYNMNCEEIQKKKQEITMNNIDIEKGHFPHYMLKEIYDQSSCIKENITNHYNTQTNSFMLPQIKESFKNIENIKIISCGTSYNAGFIAKNWFEEYCNVSASVDIASEFNYKYLNNTKNTLYIFISQSGETADTISAVKKVNKLLESTKDNFSVSIINIIESQIAKLCNYIIPCYCGAEIGVAATKSFTSSLTSLMFLCLKISEDKELLNKEDITHLYNKHISQIPIKIDKFLNNQEINTHLDKVCKNMINKLGKNLKLIWLGRGVFYGLAIEATLKTQELTYLPSLAFPFGELKHGPIAILDEKTVVICLCHDDFLMKKASSSIEEILARKANVVLVSNKNNYRNTDFIDTNLFGEFNNITSPILYALIVQLISYKLSNLLGNNVDKPRGLAKSVTVE